MNKLTVANMSNRSFGWAMFLCQRNGFIARSISFPIRFRVSGPLFALRPVESYYFVAAALARFTALTDFSASVIGAGCASLD